MGTSTVEAQGSRAGIWAGAGRGDGCGSELGLCTSDRLEASWERGARNSRITAERQGRGLASHTLWKQPETEWDRVGCS